MGSVSCFGVRSGEVLLRSVDDLILQRLVEVAEVIAVSGYADDQVLVLLRMLLSFLQHLAVYYVELDMVSVHVEVGADVVGQVVQAFLAGQGLRSELLIQQRTAGS